MNRKQKKMLYRILTVSALSLILLIFNLPPEGNAALSLAAYLIIGYDCLRKAWRGILNGQVFSEHFLMAVATLGAIALAVHSRSGDYFEAIAVMLFYQIGELFESYAVGKSRRNIGALMDIRPDYANILENGATVRVDPEQVAIGTVIVVLPGEKVPIDGVVLSGTSTLNTAALTGESLPRDVREGEEVLSGCINMTGVLHIRTTRPFGESTASKILALVEDAGARKSKSESFISKFAAVYTPAVCYGALALAVLPPVIRLLMGNPALWSDWIYRALTFLVISCPCALVISIPLSFFAGIGGASKEGILIKGSNFLETLSQVKTVVFDKTGTLTKGTFEVSSLFPVDGDKEKLLEYAAHAEAYSIHPIAKSLQQAYGKKTDRNRIKEQEEISGQGVIATVDEITVAVGNEKLMNRIGVAPMPCSEVGTVLHVATDGKYAGRIVISDTLKPNAREAIGGLTKAGITRIVMLTGDAKPIAEQVAAQLSITNVRSSLLPDEKVREVESLLSETNGKLAFVGDGINDAPVLSRGDIGIAMGALGSDAAIEAADVVLMDDDPLKITKAIKLSKKCIAIVRQNIILALGIKFACLALGAAGITNMWFAIFADVGVMVLSVLNAIRALKVP